MENAIKLTDDYYLSSDGSKNFILHERYEKREGRGTNSPLSGDYDFRNDGYFRTYEHVGNYLGAKINFIYHGSELEATAIRVEKAKEEIVEALIKYADLRLDN